jgi:hypothetical protein
MFSSRPRNGPNPELSLYSRLTAGTPSAVPGRPAQGHTALRQDVLDVRVRPGLRRDDLPGLFVGLPDVGHRQVAPVDLDLLDAPAFSVRDHLPEFDRLVVAAVGEEREEDRDDRNDDEEPEETVANPAGIQ